MSAGKPSLKVGASEMHADFRAVEEDGGEAVDLQRGFHFQRQVLLSGRLEVLDRSREVLALDALRLLARLLRAGRPDQKTLNLIADFLTDVEESASESKHDWRISTEIANRVLGYRPQGDQKKIVEAHRAAAVYELWRQDGRTEREALIAAYDAYRPLPDGRSAFAEASKRGHVEVTKGAKKVDISVAEQGLENLSKVLRKLGVLEKRRPGRKANST